jgi:histidine triad (HIT) family protein
MQPNDSACIFCKIVAAQIPSFKLYEDDDSISFLDINPANEGHALAVAKGHWPTLHDIPEPALTRVTAAAKKVAAAIQKVLSPSGINLVQSNGPGAAQSVPHFHIHILPRRAGDGLLLNWKPVPGDMAELKELHGRLLKAM